VATPNPSVRWRLCQLASHSAGLLVALTPGCREPATAPSEAERAATPVALASALVFRQVSAGAHHTCGVTVDDRAYCWGEAGGGELGTGSSMVNQPHPVPVAGGHRFLSVSTGASYTCGLTTDRLAYCWGANTWGQLGDGTTMLKLAPVRVAGTRRFRVLRAGNRHTCGVTTSNVAFCWGFNGDGALGDGTTANRTRPVRVAGGLSFTQARAGGNHSCGWTTAGKAYCWGANNEGQLGDGTLTRRLSPVAVVGGHTFAQVSPGGNHTCGATTGHNAYCWGRNSSGELGDGTTTRRLRPQAVYSGGLLFDATASGVFHTCALTQNGRAFCWGANDRGQLGNGSPQGSLRRVGVDGGLRFDALSVGVVGSHGCGVTTAGVAYCWGDNRSGQLGDGTMEVRRVPVPVSPPS
jgi:alpha-tubulin suppressor-like RCC1 family protein